MNALEYRVGIGWDSHRLVSGGPLRIGGTEIPFDHQLDGHSDGDVLLHAITDAILGAASAGDIGELFPNTDPANHKRDSADFLLAARERVTDLGFAIVNIDCVLLAERPKILEYKSAIIERIAGIVGVNTYSVGLKAKTGEGIGPVGEGKVIEAHCVALLGRAPGARL